MLAALALVVAGCGDEGEPGAAADDRGAAAAGALEIVLTEARLLRADISAVRDDVKAARDAISYEAGRASREAAELRGEIAALRLEVQELRAGASSQVERTSEEARSLRTEIEAIRAELGALREVAGGSARLSPEEISGIPGEADTYSGAVVLDDPEVYARGADGSRQSLIYQPRGTARTPPRGYRPFPTQPRTFHSGTRRTSWRKGNARPRTSDAPAADRARPPASGEPGAHRPGPQPRTKTPGTIDTGSPVPGSVRPPAPAPRPAPTIPRKPVHIPKPER